MITTRRRTTRNSTKNEEAGAVLPSEPRRGGQEGLERLTDLPVDILLEVGKASALRVLLKMARSSLVDYEISYANRSGAPHENEQSFPEVPAP